MMQTDEVAIQTSLTMAEVVAAIRGESDRVAQDTSADDALGFQFALGDTGGVFLGPAADLGPGWFYCVTNPGAGVRLMRALAARFPWRLEAYDDEGNMLAARPHLDATA